MYELEISASTAEVKEAKSGSVICDLAGSIHGHVWGGSNSRPVQLICLIFVLLDRVGEVHFRISVLAVASFFMVT